jgi:ornithine decarboxylase
LDSNPNIFDIAKIVNPLCEELFDKSIKIIAEPGRFFCTSTHTLLCNVIGKKIFEKDKKEIIYYINDGLYHSFSCLYCENAKLIFNPISINNNIDFKNTYCSIIHGPTEKETDIVAVDYFLPELNLSDWLYIENFGAYTICLTTE